MSVFHEPVQLWMGVFLLSFIEEKRRGSYIFFINSPLHQNACYLFCQLTLPLKSAFFPPVDMFPSNKKAARLTSESTLPLYQFSKNGLK